MQKEWMDVTEFPGYEIHSKDGIRNKKSLKTLKGRNWMGYPKVTLMRDGKKHERRIHKLVGEHFVPNPKKLPIVNHKDSDRSNHSVDNLEWVDNSGNQLHRWKTQKEGLKKMKYEKEYGLAKAASMTTTHITDEFGSSFDVGKLSMEDKLGLDNKVRSRGPGFNGSIVTPINGNAKRLKVSVNARDRFRPAGTNMKPGIKASGGIPKLASTRKQKEVILKVNKAKKMLYKETSPLDKAASKSDVIFKTFGSTVKKTSRKKGLGDTLGNQKAAGSASAMGTALKIGAGGLGLAGLGVLATK